MRGPQIDRDQGDPAHAAHAHYLQPHSGAQSRPARALSDGIFAVAMTLLVLDLHIWSGEGEDQATGRSPQSIIRMDFCPRLLFGPGSKANELHGYRQPDAPI